MAECSVDAVLCDPPYGIGFMGKEFDTFKPGYRPDKWDGYDSDPKLCGAMYAGKYDRSLTANQSFQSWCTAWATALLRVLKPGGMLLAFGGTRTYHRLTCAIEDAGFEIRDTMMWLYGSGFPKSLDISKAIDKASPRVGMFDGFAKHYAKQRQQAGINHNQICEAGKFYAEHNHGGASVNWEAGHNVPTLAQWETLQPLLGLSLDFLPLIKRVEAEREVVGINPNLERANAIKALGTTQIAFAGKCQSSTDITIPTTPAAKQWEGWGTALKPAWEPVVVAMKPLDGTYAENALRWGVAGINVDGCRVSTGGETIHTPQSNPAKRVGVVGTDLGITQASVEKFQQSQRDSIERTNALGRWPANLLLQHHPDCVRRGVKRVKGSPRVTGDEPSLPNDGTMTMGKFASRLPHEPYADADGLESVEQWECVEGCPVGKLGDVSRFFFTAKSSRRERNAGCEAIEGGNVHPTLKPLALCKYLATLILPPPRDTPRRILCPFSGSASEMIGALLAGWDEVVGIEKEAEYVTIAQARLAWWQKAIDKWGVPLEPGDVLASEDTPKPRPDKLDGQMELFP